MPKTLRIPILLALLMLSAAPVHAGSLTLTWDPNIEPDVVGYTVFYGTQSGVYTFSKAVGNATSWTADNLVPGQTYYFAVQAVAAGGLTSPLSAEVSGSVPIGVPACTGVAATAAATGVAGGLLTFTAQPIPYGCTGAVTYQWSFGDGASSTQQTVSHAYSAAGSYTWTLSATAGGAAVAPQTGTIAVSNPANPPCTGVAATAPATGAVGSPLTFTAQPSPPGCTGAVTYQWSFGDGTSSTQQTASHAYSAQGSYTWTLSATAGGAAVAPRTGTTTVLNEGCTPRTVLAAPPARAGVHPAEAMWQDMGLTVQAGDVLRVTAAGTWRNGSQALTAAGDASQALTGSNCPVSGAPLLALVARIGATGTPFLVRGGEPMPVTATGTLYLAPNDNWYTLWDNSGSLAVAICVGAPEPVACTGVTATVPAAGGVGSPLTFTAQPSPSGCTGTATYEWEFGDGMAGAQQTESHTYYAAESYTWTLSAMIGGVEVAPQTGTIAVSTAVCTPRTVLAAPPARAGVHPVEAMWQNMGLTVQAGDVLQITAAGTWRNGSRALTAAGDGSQVVTGSNCPVSGAPLLALVARIGATGTPFLVRGGEPIPVTTTGTVYLAPNDNWYTLWDNGGSLAVAICVSVPEPVACTGVTASAPATGGAGSPVTFTAQPSPSGCTGEVAYEWDLGDGLAGTQQTVSHTYYAADSYTWTLSAMIDGVEVAPQTGTIVVSTEACTPRTVVAAPPARTGVDPVEAMWQDMGLTVQAGNALRITAAGTWRNGSQALTAAGHEGQAVTGSNCPASGAPLLALVARIGATGTPFLVRGGEPMPVTATGKLYLAPNDNWYTLWDNSGSLAVTICSRQ